MKDRSIKLTDLEEICVSEDKQFLSRMLEREIRRILDMYKVKIYHAYGISIYQRT